MVSQFLNLPHLGSRVFFSFSSAINSNFSIDKVEARIQAVPVDRILLETDLEDSGTQCDALHAMLATMSAAKGWTLAEAAQLCYRNFNNFYDGCFTDT